MYVHVNLSSTFELKLQGISIFFSEILIFQFYLILNNITIYHSKTKKKTNKSKNYLVVLKFEMSAPIGVEEFIVSRL